MKWFRRVILQDSVILTDSFPNHRIFKHAVFASDLYQNYKANAQEILSSTRDPFNIQLEHVLPGVLSGFQSITDLISIKDAKAAQERREFANDMKSRLQLLNMESQNQSRKLDDLEPVKNFIESGGRMLVHFTPENDNIDKSAKDQPTPSKRATADEERQISPQQMPNAPLVVDAPLPPRPVALFPSRSKKVTNVTQYHFNRSVETISALYDEWHIGCDGNSPVRELESNHGSKYRTQDKKWYARRKPIFDAMENMHVAGMGKTDVVRRLQTVLDCLTSKTLHQLGLKLKNEPLKF